MLQIILTVGSLLLVAIQTYLLRKTYQYNSDWQEKEKAIELSAYYKDEILPSVAYISFVLKQTGIMERLSGIHQDNIDTFTKGELFRLTNRDIEGQIEGKYQDANNIQTLITGRLIREQRTNIPLYKMNTRAIEVYYAGLEKEKDESESANDIPDDQREVLLQTLWMEFKSIVSDTLNSLEYFSMYFVTGVADDSVVFQSLHQTFIVLVQMLYYYIAMQNTNEKDMYYTNIIELYKQWVKKDHENEQAVHSAISKTGKAVRK